MMGGNWKAVWQSGRFLFGLRKCTTHVLTIILLS
jgi:hypothetical protein